MIVWHYALLSLLDPFFLAFVLNRWLCFGECLQEWQHACRKVYHGFLQHFPFNFWYHRTPSGWPRRMMVQSDTRARFSNSYWWNIHPLHLWLQTKHRSLLSLSYLPILVWVEPNKSVPPTRKHLAMTSTTSGLVWYKHVPVSICTDFCAV